MKGKSTLPALTVLYCGETAPIGCVHSARALEPCAQFCVALLCGSL